MAHEVRKLRRRLRLTQEGFAHFMKVHVDSVVKWEHGNGQLRLHEAVLVDIRATILGIELRGDELVEEIHACLEAEAAAQTGMERARAFYAILGAVNGQW